MLELVEDGRTPRQETAFAGHFILSHKTGDWRFVSQTHPLVSTVLIHWGPPMVKRAVMGNVTLPGIITERGVHVYLER